MSDAGARRPSGPLPEGARRGLYRFGRWFGRAVLPWGFRLRVHHVERVPLSGPVVLVANHSSLLDGPLLFGQLPRDPVFLIKSEMFRGALGWFLRRLGQLPVRRGEPDRRPLLAAVRLLRAGGVVAVFPEGTRGDGGVATAQNGAAWLARSSGAVVLPVVCRGTYRAPGQRRRYFPKVDVLFGEPMALSVAKGRSGLTVATEQVRGGLVDLVAELDALIGAGHDDDARGNRA